MFLITTDLFHVNCFEFVFSGKIGKEIPVSDSLIA